MWKYSAVVWRYRDERFMTPRRRIRLFEIGVNLFNRVQSVNRFTQAWPLMMDTKQMGTQWEGAEGSEKHP